MIESSASGARPLSHFLRIAVMAGVESAVRVHIERGDDLNARDASGMTPLMLAATRNKPAICKLLLSAGADHGLLDPSGRTALEIAIAAGSDATAAILDAVRVLFPLPSSSELELNSELDTSCDPSHLPNPVAEAATLGEADITAAPIESESMTGPLGQEPAPPAAIFDTLDDGEYELSGWEAEEEPTPPEADLVVVGSARAVQIAITAHEPVDSSAGWDDIDVYLPEVALPLARRDDTESPAKLRRLLLRALREGWVPALDVQAQSSTEDGSPNPEAEAYLSMVINDLGAEVDEYCEYSDANETLMVFVDPDEEPDEEAALDEALAAINRAASTLNEPLRLYQREIQGIRLLTADEEIQLAKDMEAALDAALDSLADWPHGIERTVAAGAEAIAGARRLSSVWVAGEPDPEPASDECLEADLPAKAEPEDATDEDGELEDELPGEAGDTSFADALRRLATLVGSDEAPRASPHAIRQALAALRLNRRFLFELIDAAHGSAPCPGFARAMDNLLKARDRMAVGNLKLAFFHARKYRHSGEPLDDLAQEGNIGLLKAVDRYDWRRGFRFSTYATWWIRQQISRYVADKARTIRLPVHLHEKVQRALREAQVFEKAFSREPTIDELAKRTDIPAQKLAALLRIAPEPSRIDELSVDDMVAIDVREAYSSPDPEDVIGDLQLRVAVDRYISSLSTKDDKEERILRLRFGIGVDDALTLEEIGLRFGVTRERIRQIEAKAIRKLNSPALSTPFARLALGLESHESPLGSCAHEPERAHGAHAAKAASMPESPKQVVWPPDCAPAP